MSIKSETDNVDKAVKRALNTLTRRAKTIGEVRAMLTRAGFEEPTIELAVRRLEAAELLNDVEYSVNWIECRNRLRPKGRFVLQHELLKKGIDPDIVAQAVSSIGDDADASAAKAVLDKINVSSLIASAGVEAARRRLWGRLARRGFTSAVAARAVDEAIASVQIDFDSD